MPSRIIREGILTSDRIDSLGANEELFYRRLMSVVDDFGRFDARPQMLRVSCYPLRVDRVREADISRWLATCQTAGLIALYAVNGKPYLEMQDFRQQVRAKESKYPSPVDSSVQSSCYADATQVQSSCYADAKQVQSSCYADAPVDGGGGVDESVDDKTPATTAREADSFPISIGWIPSPHFPTLAKQSGLPLPGTDIFKSSLAEFVSYWISQPTRVRTQHEWDHALIKSLKAESLRAKPNARASPPRNGRQSRIDNYAAEAAAARGEHENEHSTGRTERDITGESIRVA